MTPIRFFSKDGVLVDIPISAVYFDDDEVKVRSSITSTPELLDWLKVLAQRGDITKAKQDAPPPSLIATAVPSGPGGNRIQIEVRTSTTPNKVELIVTQIDRYEGLKLSTLATRLGDSDPGLLRVNTNTAGAPDPIVGPGDFDAGPPPTWTIADKDDTAHKPVVLEAKRATGVVEGDFAVAITDVQPATGGATFTLTVTWQRRETIGTTDYATLTGATNPFKYLVTFTTPPTTTPQLPRVGTYTLFGGRDAVAATQASATLLANA